MTHSTSGSTSSPLFVDHPEQSRGAQGYLNPERLKGVEG